MPAIPISGCVDWASATETLHQGFDYRLSQTKDCKDWYSEFPFLTFSNKKKLQYVKPPLCVVDRRQLDS